MRIEDIIPVIAALGGGGLGGWIFGRRKQNAETKVVEGSALESMQKGYHSMVNDFNERYEEQGKRIDSLETELKKCKAIQGERSKQSFLKEYAASEFGLLIIKFNGDIEYTNPTFDRFFGVKVGHFIGKTYRDFLSEKEYEASKAAWSEGKDKTELLNYSNWWLVEGKRKKCNWIKAYNDHFNQVAYCVLRV